MPGTVTVTVASSAGGQVAVVRLVGDHDIATAQAVRRALVEAGGVAELVVIDFAETRFLDCRMLTVFVAVAKRRLPPMTNLIGINAHGIALRVLQLTGLDQVLLCNDGLDVDVAVQCNQRSLDALAIGSTGSE